MPADDTSERAQLLDSIRRLRSERFNRLSSWAYSHKVKFWDRLSNAQLREAIAYAEQESL